MAIVAQLIAAWDGSSRAQLASAWADTTPGIQVWDDFDRSSIDASLSTVGIDTDGVDLVTLRCRMQFCDSIGAAPRWLEPFGKVTGVLGKQPRFVFEPYSITSGDNRNHQTWISTQFPHYSYDAVTWYPFGSKAYLTTLRARHTEPFTQDTVYVARSWPRPLTVIGQQIEALAAAHPDKIFPTPSALSFTPVNTTGFPAQSFIAEECDAATDERGRAVPHTPLYAFEINDTNFAGPKKDAQYISANHAGEDVGEVVFWEMINYIVGSSDPEAVLIRQKYRIFVYPCANPVGKYAGYWRGAPGSNADPNRNWNNPTPPFDSITKMRNIVVSDHAGRRLYWCFNIHATAWNERMQTTPKTDFPSTIAWDTYARARYPDGDWAYYYDPNTPSTSDLPGTCQLWQKTTFNPVMSMMTETCDRPGPVSPAVMLPYAKAMIGALADIDADGWFDDAPTGTLTLGTPSVTSSSISLPWTYSAADHDGIEYRYRLTAGTWSAWIDAGLVSPIEITGLTSSAEYEIEAQAYNVAGAGTPQTVTVTVGAAADITPQDASHAHTADNLTLSVGLSLVVQDAAHAHTADNLTATTGLSLAIQDALHGHTADAAVLAAALTLAVQNASHTHTTDAATLSAALTLAVQDALHAHAADAPTLSANTPDSLTLSVADATHAHLADALALAGSHTLSVQSAAHSHTVEALTLSAVLNLLVDNALHAQLADNVALTDSTAANLVAQNATHSHLADALTLSGALALIVQDAQHAHLSEQATLSAAHSLVVQNAAHAHLADVVDASSGIALTIANAFHTHLADNVDADTALSLAIHDALHAHQAEAATLTAALTLIVSDAIHAHFADQAEFFIPVPLVDQLRRSVFLRIAQQRPFVRVDEQRVFIKVQ